MRRQHIGALPRQNDRPLDGCEQGALRITELGDPRYLGTALTMQTCIGFLITTVSIRLMPLIVAAVGWRFAFIALAPGPFLGIVAMMRLKEAIRDSKAQLG